MFVSQLIPFLTLVFLALNPALAETSCNPFLDNPRDHLLKNINEALNLEEIGKAIAITKEETENQNPMSLTAMLGFDTSAAYLSDDPFVNRVCFGAAFETMKAIFKAPIIDKSNWFLYRADFVAATNPAQFKRLGRMTLYGKTYNSVYNSILSEFYELDYFPVVEHYIVYNPLNDIVIDLTYRQFLFGKISDSEFKKLPRVFIGSLKEYRQILETYLPPEQVDFLFYSGAFENETVNKNPLLLEIEQGLKSIEDHPVADYSDDDFEFE